MKWLDIPYKTGNDVLERIFRLIADWTRAFVRNAEVESLTVTGNTLSIGDGADTDKVIVAANGDANTPKLQYDADTSRWQFSNDGTTWIDIPNSADMAILAPGSDTRNVIQPTGDYKNLVLKTVAGQTKYPFSVTDELDALKAYITPAGGGYFGGNVGIGIIGSNYPLQVNGETTLSAKGPLYIAYSGTHNVGVGFNLDAAGSGTGAKNYSFLSTGSNSYFGAGCFAIYDSTGSRYPMVLDSNGKVTFGVNSRLTGQLNAVINDPASVGEIIRGASSQSANLLQLESSIGSVLLFADKDGILQTQGYKSSDGSAGATATTGGATFKNGLYISGTIATGLTKSETEKIVSVGTLSTTSDAYARVSGPNIFYYDSGKYGGTVTVYFEVLGYTAHSSYTLNVELYNLTDSASVADSEVSITSTTQSTRARSSAITLTTGKEYTARYKIASAGQQAWVQLSRVIIQQEA